MAAFNHFLHKGSQKPKKEKTIRQKIEEAKSFATASGHTSTATGEFAKVTSKLDGLRVYNTPAARRVLSMGGQTLGMIGTAGDGIGILTDAYDLGKGEISYGKFAFNTTVTTASFYASTEIHPLAGVAVGLGGTLTTTVYSGFEWWTSKVAEFNTSIESGLRNWRPR